MSKVPDFDENFDIVKKFNKISNKIHNGHIFCCLDYNVEILLLDILENIDLDKVPELSICWNRFLYTPDDIPDKIYNILKKRGYKFELDKLLKNWSNKYIIRDLCKTYGYSKIFYIHYQNIKKELNFSQTLNEFLNIYARNSNFNIFDYILHTDGISLKYKYCSKGCYQCCCVCKSIDINKEIVYYLFRGSSKYLLPTSHCIYNNDTLNIKIYNKLLKKSIKKLFYIRKLLNGLCTNNKSIKYNWNKFKEKNKYIIDNIRSKFSKCVYRKYLRKNKIYFLCWNIDEIDLYVDNYKTFICDYRNKYKKLYKYLAIYANKYRNSKKYYKMIINYKNNLFNSIINADLKYMKKLKKYIHNNTKFLDYKISRICDKYSKSIFKLCYVIRLNLFFI